MNKFHANYFILGDLHINTNKFAMASNYSSDYLNMLTSNSVISLITKPKRVTPSTATMIDHVLTNENRLILTPFVIKYSLTNYYPIMISVSQKTAIRVKTNLNSRDHFLNFLSKNLLKTYKQNLKNFGKKFKQLLIKTFKQS